MGENACDGAMASDTRIPDSCWGYGIGEVRQKTGSLKFLAFVGLCRPDTGCYTVDYDCQMLAA